MKLVTSILLFAMISCSDPDAQQSKTSGPEQDGSDYAHAVVIKPEAAEEGMPAESTWLEVHIPGYRFCDGSVRKGPDGEEVICLTHATDAVNGRVFSIFCVRPPDGSHRTVYFDITAVFAKEDRPDAPAPKTPVKVPLSVTAPEARNP